MQMNFYEQKEKYEDQLISTNNIIKDLTSTVK